MKTLSIIAVAGILVLAAHTLAQNASEPEPGQAPPLPPTLPVGIPAFPGAWGGGMFTTGGRGGKVIAVTNLNDSGAGSLRAAIEAKEPRIVVFRVAGVIHLQSACWTSTIRTSPSQVSRRQGDGICVAGDSLNINTRNVIVRHLRVRRGRPEGGQGSDNIGGNPEGQIIVDHCSTSWGMDENLSLYRYMKPLADGSREKQPTKNVTVQWCISSEALNAKNHAFGGTWGGEDATFHHNLFACNTGRNPSIGMGGEFDFRNNVIFNWRHRTMDGGDETSLINVINNYYKPGPATNENMRSTIAASKSATSTHPATACGPATGIPSTARRPGKWYVAGNIVEGHPDVTANNWLGMRGPEKLARVNTPFEAWPANQQTALAAYEAVLANAGATLPRRDAVDRRVVEMVRSGKPSVRDGIINDPKEVGGYPNYTFSPTELPADVDSDGMPDAWETAHKLDPNDSMDSAGRRRPGRLHECRGVRQRHEPARVHRLHEARKQRGYDQREMMRCLRVDSN